MIHTTQLATRAKRDASLLTQSLSWTLIAEADDSRGSRSDLLEESPSSDTVEQGSRTLLDPPRHPAPSTHISNFETYVKAPLVIIA